MHALKKVLLRFETLIFLLAIVFAGVGSYLESASRKSFRDELVKSYETQEILVAARRIPAGKTLDRDDIGRGKIFRNSLSPNMTSSARLEEVIGRPLSIELHPGDPVLLTSLGVSPGMGGVADKIPPGKRLFTLTLTDPVLSAGFVAPGDHVDILAVMTLPEKGQTTFTLMSDIKLFAVGNSFDPNTRRASSQVSFLVTPSQMELLTYAQNKGTFRLSLRSPADKETLPQSSGVNDAVFFKSGEVSRIDSPLNGAK